MDCLGARLASGRRNRVVDVVDELSWKHMLIGIDFSISEDEKLIRDIRMLGLV